MLIYQILSAIFPQRYNEEYINLCTPCIGVKKSTVILFSYTDKKVRNLIFSMKRFQDMKRDKVIAKKIIECLIPLIHIYEDIIIIPVPISNKTLRTRGFNQVNGIALEMCKLNNAFSLGINVVVKKNTMKQSTLIKEDRLKNTINAFYLKRYPSEHTIIILDDVITTGSTMRSIEKLFQGKNKNIIKVAVAG